MNAAEHLAGGPREPRERGVARGRVAPSGKDPAHPANPAPPFRGAGSRAGSGGLAAAASRGRAVAERRSRGSCSADERAAGPIAARCTEASQGRVVRCRRWAGSASKDRTALPCRGCHVIRLERPQPFPGISPTPHQPGSGPHRAAHGRPEAGVTMASAGIRKTSTGRYKVWWRLDDASQAARPSTPATKPATSSTTSSPGWPAAAGSTRALAGRPSRPGRASGGKAGPPTPTTAHGHSKPQRRACGGTCVGSGHQTTGEAWLAASAAARAREARWIAREELHTGTIAA